MGSIIEVQKKDRQNRNKLEQDYDSLEKKLSDFTRQLENINGSYKQLTNDFDNELQGAVSEIQRQASGALKAIIDQKKEAEKIVGVISEGAEGHLFEESAKKERRVGLFFKIGAFASIILMFASLFFLFIRITKSKDTSQSYLSFDVTVQVNGIKELAMRSLLVGTFLIPFWYCASEAAKHMRISHRNKRLQMELATIRPYLQLIDDKGIEKGIMAEIAPKFFAGHDKDYDDGKIPNLKKLLNNDVLKILLAILDATTGKKNFNLAGNTETENHKSR